MLAICLKKKTTFHGSYEEQNQVIKMKLLHIITIIVKFYDYGKDMAVCNPISMQVVEISNFDKDGKLIFDQFQI